MKKKIVLFLSGLFVSSFSFAQISFTSETKCFGQLVTLTAVTSYIDTDVKSWGWDLNNDGLSEVFGKTIQNDFSEYYNQGGLFPVSLTVVTTDNVVHTMTTPISVHVFPTPFANFQVDNVCEGSTVKVVDLSTIASGSIATRSWDMKNTGSPNFLNDSIISNFNYGQVGNYTTKLTVTSNNGCSAFTTKTVKVFSIPTASFVFTQQCNGIVTNYIDSSKVLNDAIAMRLWSFGDGESADGKTVRHSFSKAGTFKTQLIAISANGCRDTVYKKVVVNPSPLDFTNIAACAKANTHISANVSSIANCIVAYNWDMGDGLTASGKDINHIYEKEGTYNVKLTVITEGGYKDSVSKTIHVFQLPDLSLTFEGDSFIYPNKTIVLKANGTFSKSLWSTNDTAKTLSIQKPGTYFVTVTNAENCSISDSIVVGTKDVSTIVIESDVLTPNGDGKNDYLKFKDSGAYTNIELHVYNRWGAQVYQNTDYKNDWDAHSLDAGAYYYEVKNVGDKIITGTVNILK